MSIIDTPLILELVQRLICILLSIVSKLADSNRGRPEGSLFISYYTKVEGKTLLLSLDGSIYLWFVPYNADCWGIKYYFWVFGMIWPGYNPSLPGHWRKLSSDIMCK